MNDQASPITLYQTARRSRIAGSAAGVGDDLAVTGADGGTVYQEGIKASYQVQRQVRGRRVMNPEKGYYNSGHNKAYE
jgi:hypothetical protein